MAPLTPDELRTRARAESVIRVISPVLDLVLAVGDRLSRLVEPQDNDYYPPRVTAPTPPRQVGRGAADQQPDA